MLKCLWIILLYLFITEGFAKDFQFTKEEEDVKTIHKAGYCTMFDECGENTVNQKKINCLYNKPAKPLTDKDGLVLLLELCPYMYKGNNSTMTCCSTNQLTTLKTNLQLPYQYLSRCPSCYRNFVALFCEMTCSKDQSLFTDVVSSGTGDNPTLNIHPYNPNVTYISELRYNITNQFADSMFNSCSHVTSPSTNAPALKLLCGPYGDSCTAQKWISYMNDIDNGLAPFQIDATFTDDISKGMNYTTTRCNESSYTDGGACSCSDCPASCSAPTSQARIQKNYYDQHFGPFYRTEQIIIQAPKSKSTVYVPYTQSSDPADQRHIPFGPILQKDILHEILELQNLITEITATHKGEIVTLNDICLKPLAPDNNNCTIMSVLNYFQNNATRLDQIAMVNEGFSLGADYHDHLVACTSGPASIDDSTKLHLPCLGTFGGPVFPWVALGGFNDTDYLNATAAVITFPVVNYYNNTEALDKAMAWEKEYITFMKLYQAENKNGNLSIVFSAERSIEDEINRESGADVS